MVNAEGAGDAVDVRAGDENKEGVAAAGDGDELDIVVLGPKSPRMSSTADRCVFAGAADPTEGVELPKMSARLSVTDGWCPLECPGAVARGSSLNRSGPWSVEPTGLFSLTVSPVAVSLVVQHLNKSWLTDTHHSCL